MKNLILFVGLIVVFLSQSVSTLAMTREEVSDLGFPEDIISDADKRYKENIDKTEFQGVLVCESAHAKAIISAITSEKQYGGYAAFEKCLFVSKNGFIPVLINIDVDEERFADSFGITIGISGAMIFGEQNIFGVYKGVYDYKKDPDPVSSVAKDGSEKDDRGVELGVAAGIGLRAMSLYKNERRNSIRFVGLNVGVGLEYGTSLKATLIPWPL